MDYKSLLANKLQIPEIKSAPICILLDENEITTWQEQRKNQLQKESQPPTWADIGIILDDPYIIVLRDLVEFPDGSRGGYIRFYNRAYLEGGAAVVVMLPEKDGKILLMHNFRHATRSWHWEIPRGFGEPGITAEYQAKIELKEEIGVDNAKLVYLGTYFSNTGLDGNPVTLFLAHIASEGTLNREIGVDIIRWFSILELEQMIASFDITDGFTIAAYTRAKLLGLI